MFRNVIYIYRSERREGWMFWGKKKIDYESKLSRCKFHSISFGLLSKRNWNIPGYFILRIMEKGKFDNDPPVARDKLLLEIIQIFWAHVNNAEVGIFYLYIFSHHFREPVRNFKKGIKIASTNTSNSQQENENNHAIHFLLKKKKTILNYLFRIQFLFL